MTLDSSHFQLVVYQRVIVTRYGKEVGMENGCGIKDPNSTRVYVVVSYAYPLTSEVKGNSYSIYHYAVGRRFRTLGTYDTYSKMIDEHPEYKHNLGAVNKLCRKLAKHKKEN